MPGFARRSKPQADAYQQKAIDAREKTIRIVAPAGSGKTQTILNRVLQGVEEGMPLDRFLILTFDRSAVKSIVSKLREKLAGSRLNPRSLRVQTLNSLGYEILKGDFAGEYRPVVSEFRARSILQEVKQALGERSPARFGNLPGRMTDDFYLEFFSLLKNDFFDPRALPAQRFADFMLASRQAAPLLEKRWDIAAARSVIEAVGWMFQAYEKVLQQAGLIDFDDQKLRAFLELRKNASVRKRLQERYVEIIVDEFQDINRLDFALIKLLAERSNLVLTGDDDQSIYGFRNCSADFMIDLEQRLERRTASYELKVNYRNPANLIEHAVRLISHNAHRLPKDPIAGIRGKAEIEVMASASAESEARLVVSYIQKIRRSTPGMRYRDFAVLFRVNAQSLPFQLELAANDIPFTVNEEEHLRRRDSNEGGVNLLTYFKSKGLEWRAVILTGCNEGVIPHQLSPVEDERRLFYTAMTRASSNLLVTYIKRASQSAAAPSRFLFEAGLLKK